MAVDLGYDESGDETIIIVSMQLCTVQKSRKFKKVWKAELKKAQIPFFHTIDFAKIDSGIFKHLNHKKRQALLQTLSQLIRVRFNIGISVIVDIEKYNSKTNQPFRSKWGTAYSHAVHMLVLASHVYCEQFGLGSDVNILIEAGHRNSAQVLKILRDVQTLNGRPEALLNIVTVGTGNKKDNPILQAADMLAYSEWRNLKNGKMEIYGALHREGSKYQARVIWSEDGVVESIVDADAQWKLWGKRRIRGLTENSEIQHDNKDGDSFGAE
jgi:hypothetical protein